jgi:hemerythrin-like domain-containing protein
MHTMTPDQFVDLLHRQHDVIDRAAGSLLAWATHGQKEHPADREVYVGFFRDWVFEHHHRLEEEVLFPALAEHAEVPPDRGPIGVIRLEHERHRMAVETLAEAVPGPTTTAVARAFVHALWEHLDKERSVELPEAARRLGRHGVTALDAPPDVPEPPTALHDAVRRHPPMDDEAVVRGDGCIMCSAFGDQCHGLETEWWSVWEWQHHKSLDEG